MATRNYVLQQRAEGVENAGRELAALHKKKGGGD